MPNQLDLMRDHGGLDIYEAGDIKVFVRPDSSDEVVARDNLVASPVTKHITTPEGPHAWLDLGGYIGTFALWAMSRGAKVFSVEADPANGAMYVANLNLNGYVAGQHLLQGAVVWKPKKRVASLTMGERPGHYANHAANTLMPFWQTERDWRDTVTVSFDDVWAAARRRMTTWLKDPTWFLKIDIEGAEMEILENADLAPFQGIYWEYHYSADRSIPRARNITSRLEGLGFTVKWSRKPPKDKPTWDWWPHTVLGWAWKEDD